MAADKSHKLTWRCPVCFARENDVTLFRAGENHFYCPKCSFNGSMVDIQEMYADLRKKYRLVLTRVSLEELRTM